MVMIMIMKMIIIIMATFMSRRSPPLKGDLSRLYGLMSALACFLFVAYHNWQSRFHFVFNLLAFRHISPGWRPMEEKIHYLIFLWAWINSSLSDLQWYVLNKLFSDRPSVSHYTGFSVSKRIHSIRCLILNKTSWQTMWSSNVLVLSMLLLLPVNH